MNTKLGEKVLFMLGLYMLLLAFGNIVDHIYFNEYEDILWFCNLYGLVLGIGVLFHNRLLIGTVLISSIFPQSLWIFDFILQLFGYGLGRTAYMFADGITFHFISLSLLHASCIPIAIYAAYKLKYNRSSIYLAVLIGGALLIGSYIFTSPVNNVNCIFYPCDLNYSDDWKVITESKIYMTPLYVIFQILFWFPFLWVSHFLVLKVFDKSIFLNKFNLKNSMKLSNELTAKSKFL